MWIGPGEDLARQVRGLAVAGSVVALAIGAHGLSGGGTPDGVTLLLLGGVAAVLAAVVTAVPVLATRRRVLVPALATGQVLSHTALSLGDAHAGAHTASHASVPMLLAHAAAVGLCAALIAAAERIGPRACSALRRILPRIGTVLPVTSAPVAPARAAEGLPSLVSVYLGSIPRRGPPVCA